MMGMVVRMAYVALLVMAVGLFLAQMWLGVFSGNFFIRIQITLGCMAALVYGIDFIWGFSFERGFKSESGEPEELK